MISKKKTKLEVFFRHLSKYVELKESYPDLEIVYKGCNTYVTVAYSRRHDKFWYIDEFTIIIPSIVTFFTNRTIDVDIKTFAKANGLYKEGSKYVQKRGWQDDV